jgi:DNA-binding NarL/FixJ family response regulator
MGVTIVTCLVAPQADNVRMSNATTETPLREYAVQVVDDHHMMRMGLMALASSAGSLRVRWHESATLDEALAVYAGQAATQPIDLVLLDLNLPDSKGLQGLRRFLAAWPNANVAVFSATEDEFVVGQALAMGAAGFVPKSASAGTTLRLVESLLGGYRADAPGKFGANFDSARSTLSPSPSLNARAATLNPTQHKVLELVLAGMSNQEIANETKLALGTVKNTVSSILLAMDVRSRSHLITLFQ